MVQIHEGPYNWKEVISYEMTDNIKAPAPAAAG